MKEISIWLLTALIIFGGYSSATHVYLSKNPRKYVIGLDSSYHMEKSWHKVLKILNSFDDLRYTEFCLMTDKSRLHSWEKRLNPGNIIPYAPRNFLTFINKKLYPEIDEADKKILITNAEPSEIIKLKSWDIIRPD